MSYELNAGGKQLAEVIEKVTWSGDSKQVARTLVFTVANKDSDRFLPKVNINEGDQVQFLEDGKLLFSGPVFDIEKSGSGNMVTYTAFDLMFYVTKSDINRVFDNEAPEAITRWICSHLGIPFGAAAATGIPIYMPWLGKKAYDGIMAAYEPMSPRAIERAVETVGVRAGERRRIHPHLLRHTFATNALHAGMDLTVIQHLLGHSDPKTTMIYAELRPDAIRYAYEKVIA